MLDTSGLHDKSVLVAGAGGLGCTALYCLAAAGVGHITIVDGDRVDEGNLNRQLLYTRSDIGLFKAGRAAARLTAQYPTLECRAVEEFLTEENAQGLLRGQDIALSCLDSVGARLILNSAALDAGIPLVDAGISGDLGRVMSVIPGVTPCIECVLGREETKSHPVLGATAVTVGALEARAAIDLLTGLYGPTARGMLIIDLSTGAADLLPVKRRPGCRCSSNL